MPVAGCLSSRRSVINSTQGGGSGKSDEGVSGSCGVEVSVRVPFREEGWEGGRGGGVGGKEVKLL